jgi:hypothetical protein
VQPPADSAGFEQLLAPELERLAIVVLRRPVGWDYGAERAAQALVVLDLGVEERDGAGDEAQPRCGQGLISAARSGGRRLLF